MTTIEATLPYSASRPKTPPLVTSFLALALALEVGTGGLETAEYYKRRGAMGYAVADFAPASIDASANRRTPVEDLGEIRAVLKPAMADLARALGVSRQAIYDWQNGKPIGAGNAIRLADLALAADVFSNEGVTGSMQLLRRPIVGGKTLFDIVREGGSAEAAAQTLVDRVRRELSQRERLTARLAGRKRVSGAPDDYGMPMLDERS